MKSYLSLIPISARVRRRQSRMTVLCIVIAVFLVTAIFSMADMAIHYFCHPFFGVAQKDSTGILQLSYSQPTIL